MEHDLTLDVNDYAGRRVVLFADRWMHHVLVRHPEVLGCLRQIGDALREPSFVYEDWDSEATRLYYRLGAIDDFGQLYLVVVVRFDPEPAQVMTAYVAGTPSGARRRLVYVKARN
jgi:hypothetical protein